MLVCNLFQFRIENTVDTKYLLSNAATEYSGHVSIKRGREVFRSPTRRLHADMEGVKSLALSSSFEISDIHEKNQGSDGRSYTPPYSSRDATIREQLKEADADVITLSVKLFNKSGLQVYNVLGFLNISDYKSRPEKRHEIALSMYKVASSLLLSESSDSSFASLGRAADGVLTMQLVYSHDSEHPSLLNFIACGLFLCPGATPLDRGVAYAQNDGSRMGGAFEESSRDRIVDCTNSVTNFAMCNNNSSTSRDSAVEDYNGDMGDEIVQGETGHGQAQAQEQGQGQGKVHGLAPGGEEADGARRTVRGDEEGGATALETFFVNLRSWPQGNVGSPVGAYSGSTSAQ